MNDGNTTLCGTAAAEANKLRTLELLALISTQLADIAKILKEDESGKEENPPAPPLEVKGKDEEKCVCFKRAREEDWFEAFWEAYPGERKVDKKRCKRRFLRAVCKSSVPERREAAYKAIMDGLERWKTCRDWTNEGGQFICAPIVWLNNERWNDEVTPADDTTHIVRPTRHADNWRGTPTEDLEHVF